MSALISTEGLSFAIRYGWRQWRHQRLQWSLLALGLACFSALLLLLLQLRAQLQEPIPSWATPAGKIASVYRQNAQGQFGKHSNVVLNKLSQLADVSAVARVRFTKADLRLAEQNLDNMPVLLYTPNTVAVLGLPAPFMPQTDDQAQPVYLSHWAWVLLGKPPLAELNVKVRQFDKEYRIAAVLPPALDRFSEHRPALWLPWADRFLPHFKTDDLEQCYENVMMRLYILHVLCFKVLNAVMAILGHQVLFIGIIVLFIGSREAILIVMVKEYWVWIKGIDVQIWVING